MRHIAAIWLSLLLLGCTDPTVPYDTYVQVNEATTPGKRFVLVLAKDPSAPSDRPDVASARFMLASGESQTNTYQNRFYPNRSYAFSASLDGNVLSVSVKINEGRRQLFLSRQQFAGWDGP